MNQGQKAVKRRKSSKNGSVVSLGAARLRLKYLESGSRAFVRFDSFIKPWILKEPGSGLIRQGSIADLHPFFPDTVDGLSRADVFSRVGIQDDEICTHSTR
jgi:hypothetical protein